jgi:hypothetical protein
MPQLLRRIKPSGKRRELAPPRIHRVDTHHHTNSAADHRPTPENVARSANDASAESVRQLRGIRDEVEELLLLASASDCLRSVGRSNDSVMKKYQVEARQVVTRLRKILGVSRAPTTSDSLPPKPATGIDRLVPQDAALPLTKRRSGTSRIQIRLTRALVGVLTAFNDAGQKPSGIVERLLWKDRNIRDAADILGIARPVPQSSPRPSAAVGSQESHTNVT